MDATTNTNQRLIVALRRERESLERELAALQNKRRIYH